MTDQDNSVIISDSQLHALQVQAEKLTQMAYDLLVEINNLKSEGKPDLLDIIHNPQTNED